MRERGEVTLPLSSLFLIPSSLSHLLLKAFFGLIENLTLIW